MLVQFVHKAVGTAARLAVTGGCTAVLLVVASKITADWYGKNLDRRRPQHELIAGFAATREGGHQAMGIPRWFEPKLEPKATELLTIKQKFMSNYLSELIHADLFPSTRL